MNNTKVSEAIVAGFLCCIAFIAAGPVGLGLVALAYMFIAKNNKED